MTNMKQSLKDNLSIQRENYLSNRVNSYASNRILSNSGASTLQKAKLVNNDSIDKITLERDLSNYRGANQLGSRLSMHTELTRRRASNVTQNK